MAKRVDLVGLGMDPGEILSLQPLSQRHNHALYRLVLAQGPGVLKVFASIQEAHEIRAYGLLARLRVPHIPLLAATETALLMEDLERSAAWRLAAPEDVQQPEVGTAVAGWYRALHGAGRQLLSEPQGIPGFLQREVDQLTPENLLWTGQALGLADRPEWRLAVDALGTLQDAMRRLPETLNHNDFYWTNLALSQTCPLQALVFDYHLLGMGPAYGDCRNVTSSLGPAAQETFWEAYGQPDPREAILDGPTSLLYGLWVAAGRCQLPAWGRVLVEQVRSGALEARLRAALELLSYGPGTRP